MIERKDLKYRFPKDDPRFYYDYTTDTVYELETYEEQELWLGIGNYEMG